MPTAYLHICIDTRAVPPVVNQVRIMSDQNPAHNFSREIWVEVLHMVGPTYAEAEENVMRFLRQSQIMFGWMNPFFDYQLFPDMVPSSPPEHSAPIERLPGLPALQRLEDFTLEKED